MNVYQQTMRRLSTTAWFRWVLSKVLNPLDMALRHTRFAPSRFGTTFPLCYLTVTGRTSGEPRTVPLLCIEKDSGYVVAGTNYGRKSHPGWVYNLTAATHAELEIDNVTEHVTVSELEGSEKAALWEAFDGVWPGYETYREIAPRDIRVFLLTPI